MIDIFKDSIDYRDLLPDHLAENPFFELLFKCWSDQDNRFIYAPSNKLRQVRDNSVSKDDNELLGWKLRRRGIPLPDLQNNIEYLQFLNQNISLFYITRGSSQVFINFLGFISNVELEYVALFATKTVSSGKTILDINSLLSVSSSKWAVNGGSYYPTPYYEVRYDATKYSLDFSLIKSLINSIQPIHLVLQDIYGYINMSGSFYVTSALPYTEITIFGNR